MSEESKVYTIPLKLFCSQEDARFAISQPFNFGRYTYATDGRIIVRVPVVNDAYKRPSSKIALNIARGARDLFKKFPKHGFIAINIPKKKDVPLNSYKEHIAQIGASNFNMKFLLAMKRLPNLKVRPLKMANNILAFTFEGGIGKVMPTFASARYTIISTNRVKGSTSRGLQKGTKPHAIPGYKEKTGRESGNRQTRSGLPRRRKRRSRP